MPKLSLGILCLILASCATGPGWITTLKDGSEVTSKGFPRLDEATGYYRCQDGEGKAVIFHEKQVASIVRQGKD